MDLGKPSLALNDPSEPSAGPCWKTCDAKLVSPFFSGGLVPGEVDSAMPRTY